MKKLLFFLASATVLTGCTTQKLGKKLSPKVITEKVVFDTDDPAIWIHPEDAAKSLIIGTDKEVGGGIYVYNLSGEIVRKITGLQRPNNVDVAYGMSFQGQKVDIAVTTERKNNQLLIYKLPELTEIGKIPVFDGETEKDPMGIAMYRNKENGKIYAIVGRKFGPSGSYLWQYELTEKSGKIAGEVVRKFGTFSGKKEIEAIAVDHALGYIYYSDEQAGVRKYYADPSRGDAELAFFGQKDFKDDHEGISIYETSPGKGYILVSNQQANTFNVYRREGDAGSAHLHSRIAEIPVSTKSSDGSEVTNLNLGSQFPKGVFVAMSEGKVFHFYDWREIQQRIDEQMSTRRK